VDVSLYCEGQGIKAHRIVLASCSTYFEEVLQQHPDNYPIIHISKMTFADLESLVEFMYEGEVTVSEHGLQRLLRAAKSLQVRGIWRGPDEKSLLTAEAMDADADNPVPVDMSNKNWAPRNVGLNSFATSSTSSSFDSFEPWDAAEPEFLKSNQNNSSSSSSSGTGTSAPTSGPPRTVGSPEIRSKTNPWPQSIKKRFFSTVRNMPAKKKSGLVQGKGKVPAFGMSQSLASARLPFLPLPPLPILTGAYGEHHSTERTRRTPNDAQMIGNFNSFSIETEAPESQVVVKAEIREEGDTGRPDNQMMNAGNGNGNGSEYFWRGRSNY
jgi:hypothetical protein